MTAKKQEHGLECVGWDNLGGGWTIWCMCNWVSLPCPLMEGAGVEFDDHLRTVGLLKEE